MHTKTIVIQTESGIQVSFSKVNGELHIQGQDVGFDAEYLQTELDEEDEGYCESRISCGYDPDVARFAVHLYNSIDAMEFDNEEEDPNNDLYSNNTHNMSSWEHIVYELWRSPSRLRNGDYFNLYEDHIHCTTLHSTFAYSDSAEGIIETLMSNRTAN